METNAVFVLSEAKGGRFSGWIGQLNALRKHFDSESDRAAAILAISFLDKKIADMLERIMIGDESATEGLLKRGLRDFANRINVCYCFGLISKVVCDDMHALRDLRNHFAYHPEQTDFQNPEAKRHLQKLKTTRVAADAGIAPRQICLATVAVCLAALDLSTVDRTRPASPDDAASILGPQAIEKG